MDPSLLGPCDYPLLEGKTWRDVAVLAKKRGISIEECNIRLQKARESLK